MTTRTHKNLTGGIGLESGIHRQPAFEFQTRLLGVDSTPCLICGGEHVSRNSFAAFVSEGERQKVIDLFAAQGVHVVEHRGSDIQVLVGACNGHLFRLKWLQYASRDGLIDASKISYALAQEGPAPGGSHCTVMG
ncbi:MAG: hypothetical protein IPP57_11665 [Candidatus Obscuribacter sp.]|jgi:hypothetical protein|nr:hypothetical protein [Candidatus Obscuribacter sp.]MDQ5966338.1 hypothetical protein [Cyanobacteriota bacterium erpe_2018_sw_39hr_WHONDRS-SW48-000098_B_bin.30]MBK7840797.1 hypothetical protein [Candidatus Obscuribacter sp.]MBK9202897.1 hypothetical protein [Candidatus Obscuribacter sp.]MBK9621009.1 hypothetical protein [Candidatus Obscuribacter sp.]